MRSRLSMMPNKLRTIVAASLYAAAILPCRGQDLLPDGQIRKVSAWASKGLTKNPVQICFDWNGNLYVAESDRAGNAVTDTRQLGHLNAVEDDLKFKSVEDRRAQIKSWIDARSEERRVGKECRSRW